MFIIAVIKLCCLVQGAVLTTAPLPCCDDNAKEIKPPIGEQQYYALYLLKKLIE